MTVNRVKDEYVMVIASSILENDLDYINGDEYSRNKKFKGVCRDLKRMSLRELRLMAEEFNLAI